MDHKFIQSISIEWNKIDHDSYLHSIDALNNMEVLDFQKNITFFVGENGSQFIIASNSPILLGIPGADIISFDEGVMRRCGYEETESYQVMEMFINHRERLIEGLLNERMSI